MQPSVLPLCVQPPLGYGVLPGAVKQNALDSVASLCGASPSLLVGQLRFLLYVVLVLPHPSAPHLVSLPVCLCRVSFLLCSFGESRS